MGKGLLSEVGDPASDGKVRRQLVRYYASGLTGFELDFDLWLDATLASYGVDSGSTIVRVEGVGGGEPRAASIDVNLAGGSVEILGVGYRRGITLPSKAWTHVHWEVRFGQPGTILVRLGSAVVLSDGAVATLTPAASAAAPPTAVQLTLGVENRKDTPTVRTRFDNVRFLAR